MLTWTLIFSIWKEFTSPWNQRYMSSTPEIFFNLHSVLFDSQLFTEKLVFECAFAHHMILFYHIWLKTVWITSLWYAMKWCLMQMCASWRCPGNICCGFCFTVFQSCALDSWFSPSLSTHAYKQAFIWKTFQRPDQILWESRDVFKSHLSKGRIRSSWKLSHAVETRNKYQISLTCYLININRIIIK